MTGALEAVVAERMKKVSIFQNELRVRANQAAPLT